jgi:hypothetical protein
MRPFLAVIAAFLLVAPAAASAQGGPPPAGDGQPGQWRERVEKRLRLARSLGLADALDLDEAGTARMNAAMAPFDARRKAVLDGIRADLGTLRQAARGSGATIAVVDAAVQRIFEARQASLAIDKEMFAALSKDLPPEKVARLALFFGKFRQRFGMEIPEPPGGRPQ